MYFSDPVGPTTLAVTGVSLASNMIALAVIAIAIGTALVIYRQVRRNRENNKIEEKN